jgi:hypothetical protein
MARPGNQNARTHGLTARNFILHSEDQELLDRHVDEYLLDWQPAGPTERDLVVQLATCQWRLHRIARMEMASIDYETPIARRELSQDVVPDGDLTTALAYQKLIREIDFLGRHEARLHRMAREARAQLIKLQDRQLRLEKDGLSRQEPDPQQDKPEQAQQTRPEPRDPAALAHKKCKNEPNHPAPPPTSSASPLGTVREIEGNNPDRPGNGDPTHKPKNEKTKLAA